MTTVHTARPSIAEAPLFDPCCDIRVSSVGARRQRETHRLHALCLCRRSCSPTR